MNFAGLQAFLAIVQTKNLTRASEALHVTPSTVSYRLKHLEQEIGSKLVERGKGSSQIRLTTHGENFVRLAERWNALWQETTLFKTSGAQIRINLSAPNSLSTNVLCPLYTALYEHVPRVNFWVRTQHTEEAIESVARREVDVAFLVREVPIPATLALVPFIEEEMVLLRLAAVGREAEELVDAATLDPEHEIYWNWGSTYRQWHDSHWDPAHPRRVQVDMAHLIPALMVDERQWAMVVNSLAQMFSQSGRFVIQRISEPPRNRVCYMLSHRYPSLNTARAVALVEQCIGSIFKGRRTT